MKTNMTLRQIKYASDLYNANLPIWIKGKNIFSQAHSEGSALEISDYASVTTEHIIDKMLYEAE